jgi:hypothetical protein
MAALNGGINAWYETHDNKPPTNKEITETIGPEAIQDAGSPHMFWMITHPKAVEPARIDQIKKDLKDDAEKRGIDPALVDITDLEAEAEARRRDFIELYGKAMRKATGGGTKPKPKGAGTLTVPD